MFNLFVTTLSLIRAVWRPSFGAELPPNNTNPQFQRLSALPSLRELSFRTRTSLPDPIRQPSSLASAMPSCRGDIASTSCLHCARDNGRFTDCVRICPNRSASFLKGATVNPRHTLRATTRAPHLPFACCKRMERTFWYYSLRIGKVARSFHYLSNKKLSTEQSRQHKSSACTLLFQSTILPIVS